MKDIIWLIRKTIKVTFSKKGNIILFLFAPLIGIFISLLAYGNAGGTTIHVGVLDQDQALIASDTKNFIKEIDHVEVSEPNATTIKEKLASGELDCVIILEKGFSESVRSGTPNHIKITSVKGAQITGFIKSYLYSYIDNITAIGKVAGDDQTSFEQMYAAYQNTGFEMKTTALADTSKNKNMTTYTMGFLIMIMLMSAGNLSEIILKEKENRTYFRLLSTPISAKKYIFSNTIVNMLVMIVQVILTLTIMKSVFHIDINMHFWEAAAVMSVFALVSVGISLFIVAFSNNTRASGSMQNLIVLPTVMLSGCFWPVEVMPESAQRIAQFLPQRWTLDTLTKLQEGHTFGSLYINFLILFAFAAAFFLVAIYKFGRNNNARNFI